MFTSLLIFLRVHRVTAKDNIDTRKTINKCWKPQDRRLFQAFKVVETTRYAKDVLIFQALKSKLKH